MAHRAGTKLTTEGPLVAEVFHWADAPTEKFKAFIERMRADGRTTFSGSTSLSPNPNDPKNGVPAEFMKYCHEIMEQLDYPVQEWRYWYGVSLADTPDSVNLRFSKGFPHAHNWDALTLIHYVQVADEGGDLVQVNWEDHTTINRFTPEVGMSVVVDGYSLHGVELVHGDTPRYVLICTAFNANQDLTRGANV